MEKKKKDPESASNGIPSNLVKVNHNNRRLTDGSISWAQLPPSLSRLGKVWPSSPPPSLVDFQFWSSSPVSPLYMYIHIYSKNIILKFSGLVIILSLIYLDYDPFQEVSRRRDSAQLAAVQAMQEASAAENLIRCLR